MIFPILWQILLIYGYKMMKGAFNWFEIENVFDENLTNYENNLVITSHINVHYINYRCKNINIWYLGSELTFRQKNQRNQQILLFFITSLSF